MIFIVPFLKKRKKEAFVNENIKERHENLLRFLGNWMEKCGKLRKGDIHSEIKSMERLLF